MKRKYTVIAVKKKKRRREYSRSSSPGMFKRLSLKIQPELSVFLRNHSFLKDKYVSSIIKAPVDFSFEEDNDGSILFFKRILSTFYLSDNVLVMDFTDCRETQFKNTISELSDIDKTLMKAKNRLVSANQKLLDVLAFCITRATEYMML